MRYLSWGLIVAAVVGGCGGANLNRRAAGNRDGGIELERSEIAVDPRGQLLLVREGRQMLVGELATRRLEPITGVEAPRLLAFRAGGEPSGFYAVTAASTLISYDLEARRVLWRRALPGASSLAMRDGTRPTAWQRLDVTADGRRVLVAAGQNVLLFDAGSGAEVGRFAARGPVEDLDVSPDGGRVIVTEKEVWRGDLPETAVHVVSSADGALLCTAVVPNCADELVVEPQGERAFLAPTRCRKDPVSIVDITASCRFETNLPGFGPIALSPDGGTGVAFLDRDVADPGAPALPAGVKNSDSRYHLMFFDTRTLALRTVAVGADMPRYAVTPDGKRLLIDGAHLVFRERSGKPGRPPERTLEDVELLPVRILEVDSGALTTTEGPEVLLDAFVLGPDSQHAWLLHHGKDDRRRLYEVDIAAARVSPVELPFRPLTLNTTPGGEVLILRGDDGIHLFDVARRQVTATFQPAQAR